MWNKVINSKFVERWGVAFTALFSPGSILSLGVTAVSLYFSIRHKENVPFSNLMAIIGSVFGGVSGAFFKDEYDKISGKNILEKKGRSALRNLQGISTQLCNIKGWIIDFSKKAKKQENKNVLHEINRHISTIELNISSGLADWVDIVPELKEKSQQEAEINKKYKEFVQSVMVELLEKRRELASTKDEKTELDLKKKISDLEKQIKEIRKDSPRNVDNIGLGAAYSLASDHIYNGGSVVGLGSKKCARCGKQFTLNYLSVSPLSIYNNDYCDDCRNGLSMGSI